MKKKLLILILLFTNITYGMRRVRPVLSSTKQQLMTFIRRSSSSSLSKAKAGQLLQEMQEWNDATPFYGGPILFAGGSVPFGVISRASFEKFSRYGYDSSYEMAMMFGGCSLALGAVSLTLAKDAITLNAKRKRALAILAREFSELPGDIQDSALEKYSQVDKRDLRSIIAINKDQT